MAIDLSQFHQVFFEESLEGLDVMESALMALVPEAVDNEVINAIFRAAHSIKGGSATFGFSTIASFTHVLETLLDQIRNGERAITRQHIDLFLQSVDCMREMLACYQQGRDADSPAAQALKSQFEQILADNLPAASEPAVSSAATAVQGWQIVFRPERHILRTGNDPLRMFRELAALGELQVVAQQDAVPYLNELSPEECYLHWQLQLKADVPRAAVEEIFEWVMDDAEILITPLQAASAAASCDAVAIESFDRDGVARDSVAPDDISVSVPAPAATTPPVVEAVASPAKAQAAPSSEASSIRVAIDKIDALINMVGELVITQSMLGQIGNGDFDLSKLPKLQEGLSQLEHNTRELQESVMRIRMLPISFAFSRFPRVVRDLAQRLGKKIDLVMIGESTELDKTVMEKIGDPLVHLVRNSVDHGIEPVEQRRAAGKPETGRITLNAFHQGGNVMIQISDDGAGINAARILAKAREKKLIGPDDNLTREQVNDLIFAPGFSTADVVSDVSGRGVGMDVVRRNIRDLGGTVEVRSEEGKGTTFTVRLPLTLAILDGQLVRVGQQTYIVPLVSIIESLQVDSRMINNVGGGCVVLRLRDEYIPVVRLFEVFNIPAEHHELTDGLVVVVESGGDRVGILVDELLAQQQVVIKSLEQNYQRIEGISGATILGDGTVALIIDASGIVHIAGVQHQHLQAGLVFRQSPVVDNGQFARSLLQ